MKPQEIRAAFIVSNYSKNARRFTQGPHKNMKKGDQLFYSNNVNFCVKTLHFVLAKYTRILAFLLKSHHYRALMVVCLFSRASQTRIPTILLALVMKTKYDSHLQRFEVLKRRNSAI